MPKKGRDQKQYERSQRQEGGKRPKREWTRFKNRTGGNQHYKPGNQDDKQGGNRTDKVRANAVSPPNAPKPKPKQGIRIETEIRTVITTVINLEDCLGALS
jgi:hypothetical protein